MEVEEAPPQLARVGSEGDIAGGGEAPVPTHKNRCGAVKWRARRQRALEQPLDYLIPSGPPPGIVQGQAGKKRRGTTGRHHRRWEKW